MYDANENNSNDKNKQHQLLSMPIVKQGKKMRKQSSLSKFSSVSLLDSSYGDSFAGDQNLLGSAANLFDDQVDARNNQNTN